MSQTQNNCIYCDANLTYADRNPLNTPICYKCYFRYCSVCGNLFTYHDGYIRPDTSFICKECVSSESESESDLSQ